MADETAKTIKESLERTDSEIEALREHSNHGFSSVVDSLKEVAKEQHETTRSMMSAEERAADDRRIAEENRKNFFKADADIQANLAKDTQQANAKIEAESQQQAKQIESQNASADSETENEQVNRDKQVLGYLKSTAGFLGGIAKRGMEKVKSGLEGLSKFAFGAFAIAALAFLNSPKFDEYYDIIMDKIIPVLTKVYEKVLKPLFKTLKEKFLTAFEDIGKFLDGEIDAFDLLWNNKVVTAGLIAAFTPSVFLAPLKLAGGFVLKQLTASSTSGAIAKFLASPAGAGIKASIGGTAIIGGILLTVADGFKGIDMAKELGLRNISGFIGGMLGGIDSGISGAFKNMGKFALIGAGIGSFIPVVGTIIGGAIGALIGGVLGFIGGEKIARVVDDIINSIMAFFTRTALKLKDKLGMDLTDAEKEQLKAIKEADAAKELARKRQERLEAIATRRTLLQRQEAQARKILAAQEKSHAESNNKITARNLKMARASLETTLKRQDKMLEALRLEEAEIKAAQAATKGAETKDTSKKLEPTATGKQTVPDAGMVKGKQYDAFGDIIDNRDQKVIKIDNKEEKTFVGATNMSPIDPTTAILAQIG